MVIGRLTGTVSSPIVPSSPFFSTPTLTFANAETIEVGRLAVALDHHDGTGNLVPGDLVLDVGIDASEPCARKTRLLGLGGDGAFGERARDGNEQHCDGSNAAQ